MSTLPPRLKRSTLTGSCLFHGLFWTRADVTRYQSPDTKHKVTVHIGFNNVPFQHPLPPSSFAWHPPPYLFFLSFSIFSPCAHSGIQQAHELSPLHDFSAARLYTELPGTQAKSVRVISMRRNRGRCLKIQALGSNPGSVSTSCRTYEQVPNPALSRFLHLQNEDKNST